MSATAIRCYLSIIVLLLLLPLTTLAQKQTTKNDNFGILYGDDHAFGFSAPKGWILDNESGVGEGLHAVFYPKGQTWAKSPVMAYARARTRDANVKTAEDVVQLTLKEFRDNANPNSAAKKVDPIVIDKTRTAQVYYYSGDKYGNYEAVAYIGETKTINFFVMSSKTKSDFEKSLPAFQSLVKSYLYLGDSPTAAKKKNDNKSSANSGSAPTKKP